jgi:hypothetical protein
MRRLQRDLERSGGGELVIAHLDGFERSWLAYFGRRHRVRLAFSTLVDVDLAGVPEAAPALDTSAVARPLLIVTQHGPQFRRVCPGAGLEPAYAGESCQLWRAASAEWALPLALVSPNGLEWVDGGPYFWLGGPAARLDVLAGAAGRLTLRATLLPGPSLPRALKRRVRVRTSGGFEAEHHTQGGPATIEVPVAAGRSAVWLECPDRPAAPPAPGGDPRPLLLGVQGLEVSFTPEAAGGTR